MTDHVHKWTYEYDNHGNGYFAEWWELYRDGEYMGRGISTSEGDAKDIVARLNATQRLSAETARSISEHYRDRYNHNTESDYLRRLWQESKAYADILEGK